MRVPRWREEKWEEGGCPGCPAFSKKQKSKKDNQWKRGPSSAHRHLVVRPRQLVQLTGRGDKKRRGRERKRELLLLAVSIVRPRERVTTLHTLAHTRISRTHTRTQAVCSFLWFPGQFPVRTQVLSVRRIPQKHAKRGRDRRVAPKVQVASN